MKDAKNKNINEKTAAEHPNDGGSRNFKAEQERQAEIKKKSDEKELEKGMENVVNKGDDDVDASEN